MDHLRTEAKSYKAEGNYKQAVDCYAQLYSDTSDQWIGFEYAQCLKNLGHIDLALEISSALHKKDQTFEYNKVLLAWLLYEKHFALVKDTYNHGEIKVLYSTALFVTELVSQNERSPYELILLKLLKILKKSGPFYEDKLLNILEMLNPSLLSTVPRTSMLKGKERIYQSEKEMYYALKTRVLFNKKSFEPCLACCDEALTQIQTFHHNNDLWIQVRKALCMSTVAGPEEALQSLEALATRKPHWVLFIEIARLYVSQKEDRTALLHYCRAAVTAEHPKMKVTLYVEMAELLSRMGDGTHAKMHVQYTKKIREMEGWENSGELKGLLLCVEDSGQTREALKTTLQGFWLSLIQDSLGTQQGVICELQKSGKAGYIEFEGIKLFFKASSIVGHYTPRIKDHVQFCLLESYDQQKKSSTHEVAYLGLV